MPSFLDRYPTLPLIGPEIPPVVLAEGETRPLVSVMIPVFRVTPAVRETLECLLAADLGAEMMEIKVIDNSKQSEMLLGIIGALETERIGYYKQPEQMPCAQNWNTGILQAKGEWVHLLHEDDIVEAHYYKTFLPMLQGEEGQKAGAAFCRGGYMNHQSQPLPFKGPLEAKKAGLLTEFFPTLAMNNRIECPAIMVKRAIYEELGAFQHGMSFAHDWYMWLRIALRAPMIYHPEVMAYFRLSDDSLTREMQASGQNVDEVYSVYATASALLQTEAMRKKLVNHIAVNQSKEQMKTALRLMLEGNKEAGIIQLKKTYENKVSAGSFLFAGFKVMLEEGYKLNKLFKRKQRLIVKQA
jgi:glycosyltransferase involved in cell wall biosynthesis